MISSGAGFSATTSTWLRTCRMLAYSSVKMQSHDAIFHPIFSSNSLSTKFIPCDYLIESRKWSIKVDWKSKVCAIFNHLSDENHDITMNFYHSIRILNRFDWKSFRVTTSTINSNRFTWAIKSIDNRMKNRIVWPLRTLQMNNIWYESTRVASPDLMTILIPCILKRNLQ